MRRTLPVALAMLAVGLVANVAAEEEGNLSRSAAVTRDRDLEREFSQVDEAIRTEQWADVADRLQSILERPPGAVVLWRGSLRGAAAAANDIIQQLPEPGRQAYQRHVGDRARQWLQQALAGGDLPRLRQIARQHRHTPAGAAALRIEMLTQLDRGSLGEAASALHVLRQQAGHGLNREAFNRLAGLLDDNDRHPSLNWSGLPEREPVWESTFSLDSEALKILAAGILDLRENGLAPFQPVSFAAAGNRIVTSSPAALVSFDADTGEVLWQRDSPLLLARLFQDAGSSSDLNRQRLLSIALLRRVFGHSALMQVTTDGERLFVVEPVDLDQSEVATADRPRDQGEFPATRLLCLDATSGAVQWETDGGRLAPCLFAGPPTPHAGRLFVQAESAKTREITLLVLDPATGRVERAIELALPLLPLEQDRRRITTACPVIVDQGWLFCPTGAGTLVVIDPLWGEFQWGMRFPRSDAVETAARLMEPDPRTTGFYWWAGWQFPQVVNVGDRLVYVSPELERLYVLDRRTGRILYSLPREDGLMVATADEEHGIIILGRWEARGFDLATGELRWSTPIPQPSGTGVRDGRFCLFPCGAAGYARLNLRTGEVLTLPDPAGDEPSKEGLVPGRWAPRNLATFGDGLYELGGRSVKRLRESPADRPESIPAVASTAEEPTRDPLAGMRQRQLEDRFAARDWSGFVRLWLEEDAAELMDLSVVIDAGRGRCLLSRWIQGFVNQEWDRLNDDERQQFHATLTEYVDRKPLDEDRLLSLTGQTSWGRRRRIKTSQTPTTLAEFLQLQMDLLELTSAADAELAVAAVRQLAELTAEHGPEREARRWRERSVRSEPEGGSLDRRDVESEGSPEQPKTANSASPWPAVVPVVNRKPRRSDDIYFSTVAIAAEAESVFDQLHVEMDWPSARGLRISGRDWPEPWFAYLPASNRSLRVEPDLTRGWGLGQLLLLQVGSELIAVSPFLWGGQPDAEILWPTRQERIDTLGDRSNLLLTFLREHPRQHPGFPERPVRRLNEFGREATAVGPVRPGYVCFQQKGMLVAVETASGRELWRRYDLPQRACCFGDDRTVIVVNSQTGHVRRLSSVDGHRLGEDQIDFDLDDILHERGADLLIASGEPEFVPAGVPAEAADGDTLPEAEPAAGSAPAGQHDLRLIRLNLVTGAVSWERTWPAGAVPFDLDGDRLGVLSSTDGSVPAADSRTSADNSPSAAGETRRIVEFIDIETGRTAVRHELNLPTEVARIACSPGLEDLLVVFSREPDDHNLINAPQRHQGYRRPLVNGPACAFDRKSGELLWQRELGNTVFPLDQPRDLPVFVTAEGRYPDQPMDHVTHGSRIRCFSRRTGDQLYESESASPVEMNYSLHGHAPSRIVTLTTRNVLVEIDFSSQDSSAAAPR